MAGSPEYLDLIKTFRHTPAPQGTTGDYYDQLENHWERLRIIPRENDLLLIATIGFQILSLETRKTIPQLITEGMDLHIRKNAGYAGDDPDPWYNFRLCTQFGISPFEGVLVRMSDKMARIQSLRRNPAFDQVDEAIIDTLADLIAYALIAVCIGRETE